MIKACGGNFHILNNRNLKDREQVSELLEKVDRMVEKKGVFNMKTAEMRDLESQIGEEEENEDEEEAAAAEDDDDDDEATAAAEEEDDDDDDDDEAAAAEEEEDDDDDEEKRLLLKLIQDQLQGSRLFGTGELEMVIEEEEEDEENYEEEEEEEEENKEPIITSIMRNVEQEFNKSSEVPVQNGRPSTQEPELQSYSESIDEPQLNSTLSSLNSDGALFSKLSEFMTSSRTPDSFQDRSSSVDGAAPQTSPVFSTPRSPIFSSTPQPSSNVSASASARAPSFSSSSPELRLVLLGRSGAGKSSVGNSVLGQNVFRSEADSFTAVTQKCERKMAVVEGQKVAVVDTSDWFNAEQTPEEVRAQISSSVVLSIPGPHAFLLCVPLDQPAKTELQALEALEKVFGPDAVTKHTVVLFTYADRLRDSGMIGNGGVEAYIADQRGDLLKLVEKCRDRFHIMERGPSEKKSVADLLALVALTMKEAGGQYFTSPAFQEAEDKVKQKQQDIARERRDKVLSQKAVRNDKPLSPRSMNLQPYMQTLFEREEVDELEEVRDEAEMSVSLTSLESIPLLTMSELSPSLLDSLKEKVESSMKMLPKLMSESSVQPEETKKAQSSSVWAIQKMVADGSLWGKVGATAGHVSKAVTGSPLWEKLGAGTKTGVKLVADGSFRVGAGIGAGAKQVAQSPVWGRMGSGAKEGVTMVAESSLWERMGNGARQVPKIVFAAGLLGLVLGVFFGGLFWGVVGAAAGSAASEMGRQKFISRSSSRSEAARNGSDGGKSLKSE
ncbi:GTPase IMAP family member 4 [Oryzias melastigma]|uniref:GTPase IMAP family member 4 n=1 Tax=Oryzias melastigma TaxID=30732 RepID=A0A834BZ43_ORYME|nr:GTPase IMAP family member 4 [Oryzias melastigma]